MKEARTVRVRLIPCGPACALLKVAAGHDDTAADVGSLFTFRKAESLVQLRKDINAVLRAWKAEAKK